MEYSIICSSKTGNTAMLAEAIAKLLPKSDCRYRGEPSPTAADAPVVFVGFWTEMGNCDKATAAFLGTLTGKKIFLFGTAGFGGSKEYFGAILDRVQRQLPPTNRVVGTYMCVGKMPPATQQRYQQQLAQNPDDARMVSMLENYDKAISHPDVNDLKELEHVLTITEF